MFGLINRSLQCFLRDTYGQPVWDAILREARLDFGGFEAMLSYPDDVTDQVIAAAAVILHRPGETLLEDLGLYLVSDAAGTPLRRLLRFSGENFTDFLTSLEELPGRGRLILPELDVPDIALSERGSGNFILRVTSSLRGCGHVLVGLLRAMADDYGALVLLENLGSEGNDEVISIRVADQDFAAARPFSLALAEG